MVDFKRAGSLYSHTDKQAGNVVSLRPVAAGASESLGAAAMVWPADHHLCACGWFNGLSQP
jgi:hypothetical protein